MFATHTTAVMDILGSDVYEGEIRVNIGDHADQDKGFGADAALWQHFGFASRPANADTDGACMALVAVEPNAKRVIATRDNRFVSRPAILKPGETMVYGAAGQFIRCHEDGSISLFTTDDGTADGRSIFLRVSPQDGFQVSTPWGRMSFGPNGFHVLHSSGARIDLGAIGGVPSIGPVDIGSYAKIQAAMCSLHGSAVSLGTSSGGANNEAVLTLITLLDTLAAIIDAKLVAGVAAVAAVNAAKALPVGSLYDIGKVV